MVRGGTGSQVQSWGNAGVEGGMRVGGVGVTEQEVAGGGVGGSGADSPEATPYLDADSLRLPLS